MNDTIHAALSGWGNFYLITGTAAAALTGLQFVVQSLLASVLRSVSGGDAQGGIDAFGTPTVVHFSLALVVSAVLCAPWAEYAGLRATLGVLGAGALVYAAIVMQRARRQRSYVPAMEDWLWHVLLPAVAYGAVVLTAVFLRRGVTGPLFIIAAATLLLLCIGIHNAWDTVTYLTLNALRTQAPASVPAPPKHTNPKTRGKHRR
jgi:hypothetical protein